MAAVPGNRALLVNYLLLLTLGAIWGSQFLLNELAIVDFKPSLVAGGRIVIGALTLTVLVWLMPRPDGTVGPGALPTGLGAGLRLWGLFFVIGGLEATVPFFLIAWGQQHIHSGIAAILLGFVPLLTLLLSAVFVPGERLGVASVVAVLLALAGVTVLVGPSAFTGVIADIYGELAVLGASVSFAIAYVMLSRLPPFPFVYKARNMLICAAVQITVAVLIVDHDWSGRWSLSSIVAVVILGTVCSGVVFYSVRSALIHRAGPTFTSLNNSLIPPIGVLLGIVFLGERFTIEEAIAIALVLLALVAISLPKGFGRRLASRRG